MNKKFALAGILIVIGAIFRLIPHPNNFTPVAAMALLGGMYISKKYLAILVPVMALFLSDLVLNNTIHRFAFTEQSGFIFWSDFMTYTYMAIVLTVGIGFLFSKFGMFSKIIGGALSSSILFFFVTNVGTWLSGTMYVKSFAGLMTCLIAGIPFFANTLLSNLLFVGLFVFTLEQAYKLNFIGRLVGEKVKEAE